MEIERAVTEKLFFRDGQIELVVDTRNEKIDRVVLLVKRGRGLNTTVLDEDEMESIVEVISSALNFLESRKAVTP